MTVKTSADSMPVFWRFWLGSVIPSLVLAMLVGLLLATGNGKREAPLMVFFTSLFAVPAIILLDCWVLFVNWQKRSLLIAAGAAIPAIYLFGCLLFIHGSGSWQALGMLALLPFMSVPMRDLGTLTALWVLAIVALLIMARRMTTNRHRPLKRKLPVGHVNDR